MLACAFRSRLHQAIYRSCLSEPRVQVERQYYCLRKASSSALETLSNLNPEDPSKQVWRFKSDPGAEQRNSVVAKKGGRARTNVVANASNNFPLCLESAAKLKLEGTRPDLQVYHALMHSASVAGAWLQAWAILDDMLLVDVKPDVTIFNHLIHAHRHRPSLHMWKIFDKMNELGIQPNSTTYTHLITQYTADKNVELALRYFFDMKSRGLVPQAKVAQNIVLLAAELGHPRLAIDVATWYESQSLKQLESKAWLSCLASSAEECYADGVLRCWKVVVEALGITPDEGTCMAVLHTAARHGLADLATDALRVLKSAGAEWQEYHFASVVEAFCRNSQMKEALLTLNIMRTHNIPANLRTTRPILNIIGTSTDALDETWNIIEEIQKENNPVDAAALNVLIQAAVGLADLQRAIGSYKSFKEYNASPDIDTFNTLLDGCVASKHRPLGDLLLDDMKAAKVKPNEETFEKMIFLCLSQESYEDAFYYLEEMKAAGHLPPVRVYAKIIRKCLNADDARYRTAIEEMRQHGYNIPASLKEEVKGYAKDGSYDFGTSAESKGPVHLNGVAQKFIETRGLPR